MKSIDLNADIGEGFPNDDSLLGLVSSANVCCGAHAGSQDLAEQTVEKCRRSGVRVGAHPGSPDRASMGRGPLPPFGSDAWAKLEGSLLAQVQFLVSLGADYLKPHGELYNQSASQTDAGNLLERLLVESRLPLMGLRGTSHEECAQRAGVAFIAEGFADRLYASDGRLVSRSVAGSVLSSAEAVAAQALRLAAKGIDSLCVHGDMEGCVELVRAVRETLLSNGYVVTA